MSYDIVYDRQFIKTMDNRIIPLVLIGCNNLTQTTSNGRERRVRDWNPMCVGRDSIALTPDKLMERVKGYTGGKYQEHFKRGGKWVDDAGLIRFFENGIKSAKTLEELSEECTCTTDLRGYFSIWCKNEGDEREKNSHEATTYIRSSDELSSFIEKAEQRLSQRKDNETIFVCLGFLYDEPLARPKKRRQPKDSLIEFFAVKRSDRYITKLTRAGLYHSSYASGAKQFKSQKDAEKWLTKNAIDKRFNGDFIIERVA